MQLELKKARSQNDLIQEELENKAGKWVPMPRLVDVSGSYNIHSRIDELRRKRFLNIACKVEQQPDGSKHSYYMLIV